MSTTTLASYSLVTNPVSHKGCPSTRTPVYEKTALSPKSDKALLHKYTPMTLVHRAKDLRVKNSLSLKDIHHQLELNALHLTASGSSNILLSHVSFDCLIRDIDGREIRDYISFDLRIPGTNGEKQIIFSYDLVKDLYGGRSKLYRAIEHFYTLGRSIVNSDNDKHGHKPDYDYTSSKHDQYILHTEQLLVAYLALPEAAEMLSNRLRTELRAKHQGASFAKIYNMGLHMHSTKSCCAPCEYALIGLMNDRLGIRVNRKQIGLFHNFTEFSKLPNERLSFTLPNHSSFKLAVTVTSTQSDADHRKQPEYTSRNLSIRERVPSFEIDIKTLSTFQHIFTTMLDNKYEVRKLSPPFLSDITVAVSGSEATKGTSGTKRKVKETRETEIEEMSDSLFLLRI